MKRERIDKLLVARGFASTRTKAQALVMSGVVLANEQRVEKPSQEFSKDAAIRIKGDSPESKYASRGGLKLEAALREFQIVVKDSVCLDVGASTGGFTDCLLQHGAKRVVALDVGHSQLDWKIRNDLRVEVREGVNARYLSAKDFAEQFDLIVVDVSFISLTQILPPLPELLKQHGKIIALIKPQFEVGKSDVGKGGIVRDPELHKQSIEKINACALSLNLRAEGLIESPILGAEGNKEFLAVYSNDLGN
jgi:23S rRNA (cytidine1920-2'-O)/16S rRNA (cytidine1409-2'-O)-methyltransferase